jgi:hypothetical protein
MVFFLVINPNTVDSFALPLCLYDGVWGLGVTEDL